MADKELRKMTRTELIEIIYALQQSEKSLRAENERLNERLRDKMIRIEQSGSIAEAALSLNQVFENAENAAQQYLFSLEGTDTEKDKILEDARQEAEDLRSEAQKDRDQAAALLEEAEEKIRVNENERKAIAVEREKFVRTTAAFLSKYPEIALKMLQSAEKSAEDVK